MTQSLPRLTLNNDPFGGILSPPMSDKVTFSNIMKLSSQFIVGILADWRMPREIGQIDIKKRTF